MRQIYGQFLYLVDYKNVLEMCSKICPAVATHSFSYAATYRTMCNVSETECRGKNFYYPAVEKHDTALNCKDSMNDE